jgi:ribokinase
MKNDDRIDFLGVGDIVTDNFIELEKVWIETDNPYKEKELCMKFGSKIPYKDITVIPATGNSQNATICAKRLGLKTAVVTNTGNDSFGQKQIQDLKANGIITNYLKIHENKTSSNNYVLRFGAERTILIKHNEFDYEFPHISPSPKFMYLSSLAENSLPYHGQIARFLKDHPETKLAFQPGTFQIKLGYEKLRDLYQLSYLFFCNKDEAESILGIKDNRMKILLHKIHELGPKIIVITDGILGSFVYDSEKDNYWFIRMYPDPAPPVDRTGAGDAFSGTFTAAIALGYPIETALSWGPINSMSVVQHVGAQKGLLHLDKLEQYLRDAPKDYKAEKF